MPMAMATTRRLHGFDLDSSSAGLYEYTRPPETIASFSWTIVMHSDFDFFQTSTCSRPSCRP